MYFFIAFKLKCVTDLKEVVAKELNPPSQYSRTVSTDITNRITKEKMLVNKGINLCYHRGENALKGNDVSIYYPAFHTFVEECNSIEINAKDCDFAQVLCWEMANLYTTEEKRTAALHHVFKNFLHESSSTDQKCDLAVGGSLLVEVKNEEGSTNCEPLPEVISYYCQSKENKPAFLMVLCGASMTIYGAVFVGHLFVDRLIPTVWLVPQIRNSEAMIHIARTLKALKNAVCKLMEYKPLHIHQPQFPAFQNFQHNDDIIQIEYSHEIKPHVFCGSLQGGDLQGTKVIIKFAERYSVTVHEFLAENSYAPTIFYHCRISRFTAVVMQQVVGPTIKEYLANHPHALNRLESQCTKIYNILNKKSYVHGDLRYPNILIDNDGNVKIIDFDWAGYEGQARYPYFLNKYECKWPDGVSDGQLILTAHDKYFLNKFDY